MAALSSLIPRGLVSARVNTTTNTPASWPTLSNVTPRGCRLPVRGNGSKRCALFASPILVCEVQPILDCTVVFQTSGWPAGVRAMKSGINITAAKAQFSKLVDRAAAGEEIVITKAGKPVAKLVPYRTGKKHRLGGQNLLGLTYIAEDFDVPLPPEIQKYFDGKGEAFPRDEDR